jgi:phage shock protein C
MAKMTRPRRGEGRVIAGVCAAVANSTGLSVTGIRILFVIAGFVGAGEIVYLVLWLLVPKRRD